MNQERFTQVDDYITATLLPRDPVFDETLHVAQREGLPPISVSAPQGMLLHLLVRMLGARRVLEVGTLAGYSAIWMARGIGPVGWLVTLEVDPHHADVARANFEVAGVADVVDLRVGPALDSLQAMRAEGIEPFDVIFIDADKQGYPEYVRASLELARPGTVMVLDNMIREGRVVDESSDDVAVLGVRGAYEVIASEPRLAATAIQTVGSKGYDGYVIALVAD